MVRGLGIPRKGLDQDCIWCVMGDSVVFIIKIPMISQKGYTVSHDTYPDMILIQNFLQVCTAPKTEKVVQRTQSFEVNEINEMCL